MPTLAPLRIEPQTRVYTIDPPGVCRVCGADVPTVECVISGIATPGPRDGATIPLDVQLTTAIITATACGHVLNHDRSQP